MEKQHFSFTVPAVASIEVEAGGPLEAAAIARDWQAACVRMDYLAEVDELPHDEDVAGVLGSAIIAVAYGPLGMDGRTVPGCRRPGQVKAGDVNPTEADTVALLRRAAELLAPERRCNVEPMAGVADELRALAAELEAGR